MMINENVNIDIFDAWALKDKDKGMEKGHAPSVNAMLDIIKDRTNILKSNFNFLDLGCGNGWVVRQFSNNRFCNLAIGVDGSKNMIQKARLEDLKGKYFQSSIESWSSENQFDIVFSMETFYYLNDIDKVLKNIYSNIINNKGFIIIGIDHYLENKPSLSWEKEIGIQTQTLSISNWVEKFRQANFKDVKCLQFGKKDDWSGTLIIFAKKY